MAVKINKKIVSYSVLDKDTKKEKEAQPAEIFQLGDPLSRPDQITGSTYKVKTPVTEHALYITINDVIMNEGTEQEHRRPFEIFVNSKNMEHFQWIVALTRVMSAVFRKGGDITFLVEELGSVFDPNGLDSDTGFPTGSQLCKKCNIKASIMMDGCLTCLNCGESKCG